MFNVVLLLSGPQEICCFLECHPTCQFRILFLSVLEAVVVVCTKPRQTPVQNNIAVCSYSHSAQSHCFMNTDYQRSQKF